MQFFFWRQQQGGIERRLRPVRSVGRLALVGPILSACLVFHAHAEARFPVLTFLDDLNVPTGTPFSMIGSDDRLRHSDDRSDDGAPSAEDAVRRKASGTFGGISAIAYDADAGRLWALSDSVRPVVFCFRLELDHHELTLKPDRAIYLTDAEQKPVAEWSMDPEAFALLPEGNLLVASEGFPQGIPKIQIAPRNPAIYSVRPSGTVIGSLNVPLKMRGLGNSRRGTHVNRGIESLTISPTADRIFVATEGPLKQDGPAPSPTVGGQVRIFECLYNGRDIEPSAEYVYPIQPPPVPKGFRSPQGGRGLSELLAVGDGDLLSLERSFIRESEGEPGERRSDQRIEIYHVDLTEAEDVRSLASLAENAGLASAKKTLLLDLREIIPHLDSDYSSLDNFEGMCFGPRLDDGSRTLLLVSDNNFNTTQRTAFFAFKLTTD